jgi:hypothetical protein
MPKLDKFLIEWLVVKRNIYCLFFLDRMFDLHLCRSDSSNVPHFVPSWGVSEYLSASFWPLCRAHFRNELQGFTPLFIYFAMIFCFMMIHDDFCLVESLLLETAFASPATIRFGVQPRQYSLKIVK